MVRAWECGSRTLWRVWDRFPDVHTFLNQPASWIRIGMTDAQREALLNSRQKDMKEDARLMNEQGIAFCMPEDPRVPGTLRTIPDPPAALFIRGSIRPDELRIAVVGTRSMTSYGKRCAEFIARELANAGATIVSGLAFGIDAVAHRSAMDAGGRTIAVLPSGADDRSITPQTHINLAKSIIAHDGALVSENAPGTPTLPYQYLHRNRIISGLSDAVIVVEGDRGSGALVTAKLALEQGRDVLAVPGSIWSNASRGTNDLIKEGAQPCTSLDDLWTCLGMQRAERASSIADMRASIPATEEEQLIIDACIEPISIDDVTRKTGLSPSNVNAIISLCEMKGRIVSVGPKVYVKTA
jgi:DNA processing protein